MKMARLTPEGKVIFALWDAPARFEELKRITGLSGAWLNRTLKRLHLKGLVEHDLVGKTYSLKNTEQLQTQINALAPIYLSDIASMIAGHLAKDERVQAVILFGSVVTGEATAESDIDLLVVLDELNREIERKFDLRLSELGFGFKVAIEPTFLSKRDFEATLAADVGLRFGLARGYEVLYDRTSGTLTKLLDESIARVKSDYSFVQEGGIWLPKKGLIAKA